MARSLARSNTRYGQAWGDLVAAGAASLTGNKDTAIRLLQRACTRLQQEGMKLFAALGEYRLGQMLGGDEGHQLVQSAEAFIHAQHIVRPERWAAMLTPGFEGT